MYYNVNIDRHKYIGGSDIPIIMGLSKFKTRYQLLLEKAGIKEDDFKGNKYTEYGQIMESIIRNYINNDNQYQTYPFKPNQVIKDDLRVHTDGYSDFTFGSAGKGAVLEIKTTSNVSKDFGVRDYKHYVVQLLFGMMLNKCNIGVLAVYHRPEDLSTNFDENRLETWGINIRFFKEWVNEINTEIERFRADLERIKNNPLLTEEDLQPKEIITLSNQLLNLENKMLEYKQIQKEHKELQQQLYEIMKKYNVKTWEMLNGTKITRVNETESKTKNVFDLKAFENDFPEIYQEYSKQVEKTISKRRGTIRITIPKNKELE